MIKYGWQLSEKYSQWDQGWSATILDCPRNCRNHLLTYPEIPDYYHLELLQYMRTKFKHILDICYKYKYYLITYVLPYSLDPCIPLLTLASIKMITKINLVKNTVKTWCNAYVMTCSGFVSQPYHKTITCYYHHHYIDISRKQLFDAETNNFFEKQVRR